MPLAADWSISAELVPIIKFEDIFPARYAFKKGVTAAINGAGASNTVRPTDRYCQARTTRNTREISATATAAVITVATATVAADWMVVVGMATSVQ
mmetsp:Transcript_14636/g.35798  ORF Transcript_14636/g.35798 Transcript_14636/m.35798 type:complete len:96 (-) Transcript_14636:199-486(-)